MTVSCTPLATLPFKVFPEYSLFLHLLQLAQQQSLTVGHKQAFNDTWVQGQGM